RADSSLYIILGRKALDPATPAYTRRYFQHEQYLATQHTATEGPSEKFKDNGELDAWTRDFLSYFHLLGHRGRGPAAKGGAPIYCGDAWNKLFQYYESKNTSAEARKKAVQQLSKYYICPPSSAPESGVHNHPTTPEGVQELFRFWLDRRQEERPDSGLIKAIRAEMK